MQRSLRNAALPFARFSLALVASTLLFACASSNDSQWKGDDGGYGGTGRFNPVGAQAGSDDQYSGLGTKKN